QVQPRNVISPQSPECAEYGRIVSKVGAQLARTIVSLLNLWMPMAVEGSKWDTQRQLECQLYKWRRRGGTVFKSQQATPREQRGFRIRKEPRSILRCERKIMRGLRVVAGRFEQERNLRTHLPNATGIKLDQKVRNFPAPFLFSTLLNRVVERPVIKD